MVEELTKPPQQRLGNFAAKLYFNGVGELGCGGSTSSIGSLKSSGSPQTKTFLHRRN